MLFSFHCCLIVLFCFFFFSSRRRHTRLVSDWSSDVCSSDLVRFLKEHGFKHILNNQRAQAFYSKWLSQYGDDSIAQVTGTHIVVWGISQVAMKFVEDQRIGLEPIEKSTRFVNFGSKVGGRFLYYISKPDLERLGLLSDYKEIGRAHV